MTLLVFLASVPAKATSVPTAPDEDFTSFLFTSLISFAVSLSTNLGDTCAPCSSAPTSFPVNTLPSGFSSSVYPEKGLNGPGSPLTTYDDLPITPIITGCCASSPSRKNPITTSPCEILIGFDLPLCPLPP